MKLVVALASLFVVGCSSGAPASEAAPTPSTMLASPASQTRGPVLATVVTRDKKVAIVGGAPDLRVVVRSTDGALVADGLSLDELRAKDPFLAVLVESAVAGADDGSYVDATFRKEKAKPKLLGDL
jgi:hypothetical protein